MLLYGGDSFLQILEGEEEEVTALYEKILQDERHTDSILLDKSPIQERIFSAWSMGFKHLKSQEIESIEGFSDFLQRRVPPSEFAYKIDSVIGLLYEFKQNS
ncbi:MAG: hypothetical protein AUK54_04755 [Helicobacteraceae bacterium CG2_30_36_10]|nr:MAG: hypothetical protein AUK54_04755 [Helicobacteraceae bacterium CG2_30_36_10]